MAVGFLLSTPPPLKTKGAVKSSHLYLQNASKTLISPSVKAQAWTLILPVNGNVQLPPILSIAVSPVLWCTQEKIIRFQMNGLQQHSSLSISTLLQLKFMRIIYFYLFPGLIIHMHYCHLLSPSHKYHIKGLMAPCILGLYVLASAVSSVWEMSGSHLFWHTSMGQFQCPTFDILWRSSSSEYLRAICISSSLVPPPITAIFQLFTFSPYFSYQRLAHSSLCVFVETR